MDAQASPVPGSPRANGALAVDDLASGAPRRVPEAPPDRAECRRVGRGRRVGLDPRTHNGTRSPIRLDLPATATVGQIGYKRYTFVFCSPIGLDSLSVAVLLFCRCGSDRVDITQWNGPRAQVTCYTCGQTAWLEGFTVSEFDLMKSLTAAAIDQARKHRKRNPSESQALERSRREKR
jgi:hypothetical protein